MPFSELDITDDFLRIVNDNPKFKVWLLVDHNTAGNPVYPATIYLGQHTNDYAQFLHDVKQQYNEKGCDMDDIYHDCGDCIINKHPLMKPNRDGRP